MWSFLKNRLEGGVVLLRGSFFYFFFRVLDLFIGMNIPKIVILYTPYTRAFGVLITCVLSFKESNFRHPSPFIGNWK